MKKKKEESSQSDQNQDDPGNAIATIGDDQVSYLSRIIAFTGIPSLLRRFF